MTYKCKRCGHIFEDGEQYFWEESHGEKFSGCPICKCDYDDAKSCKSCGAEHFKDELFDGYCLSCLRKAVDIETGLAYIKDRQLTKAFVFYVIFGVEEPMTTSRPLEEWCEFIARENAQVDQLVSYIIDDDEAEAEDFANWLNAKEVK